MEMERNGCSAVKFTMTNLHAGRNALERLFGQAPRSIIRQPAY